jgi:hypothetical protein
MGSWAQEAGFLFGKDPSLCAGVGYYRRPICRKEMGMFYTQILWAPAQQSARVEDI